MAKIKVHALANQGTKFYQLDASTGNFDTDVLSAVEVESNPTKYEVSESTPFAKDVLRESVLPEGWKKVSVIKSRFIINERDRASRQREDRRLAKQLREDAAQNLIGTGAALVQRGYKDAGKGLWTRSGAPDVTVADDGSSKCCGQSFADSSYLKTHLDSTHPAATESFRESTRKRINEACKILGISEGVTDSETSDLIEAWGLLLGSREAGAAMVRGKGNTH